MPFLLGMMGGCETEPRSGQCRCSLRQASQAYLVDRRKIKIEVCHYSYVVILMYTSFSIIFVLKLVIHKDNSKEQMVFTSEIHRISSIDS